MSPAHNKKKIKKNKQLKIHSFQKCVNDRNNKQQKEISFFWTKNIVSFIKIHSLVTKSMGKQKKQNDIVEFGSFRDSNGE